MALSRTSRYNLASLIRFDGRSLEVVAAENLLQIALKTQGKKIDAPMKSHQPQQPHPEHHG